MEEPTVRTPLQVWTAITTDPEFVCDDPNCRDTPEQHQLAVWGLIHTCQSSDNFGEKLGVVDALMDVARDALRRGVVTSDEVRASPPLDIEIPPDIMEKVLLLLATLDEEGAADCNYCADGACTAQEVDGPQVTLPRADEPCQGCSHCDCGKEPA